MATLYVNSAYTDEELANLNAASTVAYRSLADAQESIAEGDTIELVITEDCEINDWSNVAKITIQNGATVTTESWDNSINVVIDAGNNDFTSPVINYVGLGSINYANVTVTGEAADGVETIVLGNKLYAGSESNIIYNNPSFDGCTAGQSVEFVLDGKTFSGIYGTNVFAHMTKSSLNELSGNNKIVIISGSYDSGEALGGSGFGAQGNVIYDNIEFTGSTKKTAFQVVLSSSSPDIHAVVQNTTLNSTLLSKFVVLPGENVYAGNVTVDFKNLPNVAEQVQLARTGNTAVVGDFTLNITGSTITGAITDVQNLAVGGNFYFNISDSTVDNVVNPLAEAASSVAGDFCTTLNGVIGTGTFNGCNDKVTGKTGLIVKNAVSVTAISAFDTVTLDAASTLTVSGTFEHTGTINIDGVIKNVRKIIDAADTTSYDANTITVDDNENSGYFTENGDLFVYSTTQDTVYLNKAYTGEKGTEIADGIYCGINAFSTVAAAKAALSSNGVLVINDDITINDWTGVSKVIIKNGATVTTDNWDSDIELTIDLTGVDTLGYLTTPSIVYTGDAEQISYGNVAIVGPATAGGWVSGNDLYVGNGVVYNHAGNEEVTNPDSVTIRGTTFTKADGSKFTVYNYWAGGGYSSAEGTLVEKPADQAGVDKQPGAIHKNLWHTLSSKNPNAMVVCTGGSGDKKYTGNYSNANLYGNVIFIDAVFTKDAYYNDKVWSWDKKNEVVVSAGANNYVTLLKGIKENSKTTFDGFVDPGLNLVIFYNTTSSTIQQVSLDLINSNVGNIQYVRSGANYTGTLSINLEDSIVRNLSGMSSGIPTLGIIDVNLSGSTVTGNISGGNGNSSSEGDKKVNAVDIDITDGSYAGTVYGGHIINSSKGGFILNGAAGIDTVSICVEDSTVNTIYASHFITNANSAKQTSTVAGNVSISLKNAKVTNIYAVGGAAITGNVTTTVENSNILGFISATGSLTGNVSGSVTGDISLDVIGTNRVAGNVDGFEFVNLSANSALTVGGDFTLAENGKIVIDAANYQGGYHFVLNVTGSSNVTAENIEFVNGTLDKVVTDSGDIYVYDSNASKTIYVDASLSGLEEGIVTLADGTNVYVGKNAFATLDEALTAVADGGVIILNGDHTVEALDNAKVSEYIINGKVTAGNVSCDNITINAATGRLIADTLNADVRLDIKSISDANLNNCVLHVKGTHTGNIVPANNGVFESYSDGKSVFVTSRQNDDIYINKNWTKQADVDAAGINAVWNVNAFSTLTPTQTGRINSDKTIHLLGSDSDEFVNPNNLPLYGADLVVDGGKWIFKLFGGGVGADSYGDSKITVKDNGLRDKAARDEFQTNYASDANKNDPFNLVRVYGGNGQGGRYYGDTVLNVSNSGYKMIVGGGMGMDEFYGDITIVADNVYAENFVGGSQENGARGKIYGDISVTVTDSEIGSFIGANSSNGEGGFEHSAFVTGSVDVTVSNTTFASTVYAGSRADSKNDLQGNKDSYVKAITLNMSNSNITSGSLYITGHNHVQTDVSASLANVTVKENIFLGAMEYVGGKYIVSGNASLSLNGVSVGSNIYGDQFDNITGIASLALSGTNNVSGSVSGFDTVTINAGATLIADAVTVGNINVALAADGAEELLIIDTNSGITVTTGNISGDNEYDVYVFNGDLWASKKLAAVAVGYDDADSDGFVTINGKQVKLFNTVADANNALRFGGSLYIGSSLNGGTNKIENVEVENNVFGAGNAETPTSVDLSISGATTQAVLGGGSSSGSKVGADSAEGFVGGTIKLTLTDSNVGTVYGGGYSSVVGDIALSIKDSICKNIVYGGNVTNTGSLTADTESTIGDVALTINGGEFNNKVVGGSRVVASENSPVNVTTKVGNVTLNIDGGHFADSIFGAGYILGNKNDDGNESNALLKVAGVTMTLNGAEVADIAGKNADGIYAGGLAARGAIISVGTAQARSTGSSAVNITVNSGKYTSIYGGGWAESGAKVTVYGVSINVTGGEIANLYGGGNNDQSGARTNVDGDVLITISGGTIGNVCAGAKFVTSKVKGSSTVRINGEAEIGNLCGLSNNGYDGIVDDQILDVDAALSCNSISGFDKIDIAAGKDIDIASAFDLGGVELNIAEQTAGWDVLSAVELSNLDDAVVKLGNEDADWDSDNNRFVSDSYSLSVQDKEGKKSLIFGTLA